MNPPIAMLWSGQAPLFALLLAALVLSLTCHEFGHAWMAMRFGDDTAKRAGRLTLNPLPHLDVLGLLMVVLVGIGYAKPVPTDPRNFRSPRADLWVAAAGPAMNLLLAVVVWNGFGVLAAADAGFTTDAGIQQLVGLLVMINLLLAVFNLVPIGPLDGHYILPHFLPRRLATTYRYYNARYGAWALLALIGAQFLGVPVFSTLMAAGLALLPWVTFF